MTTISDEALDEARKQFRAGKNFKETAEAMGVTTTTLRWRLLKSGFGTRLELVPLQEIRSAAQEAEARPSCGA